MAKGKTFGLDIGTTSIKAASLSKNGSIVTLDAISVSPSSPKGILSESLIDQQTLADTIKRMLEQADINSKISNIAIPESQVYTKIIEMPELSEKEVAAALRWEMEQYIPLPLDQVRTDWQILDRRDTNGRKTIVVLIVAASLAILQKYEKILGLAGLTPDLIESEMISVQRALYPIINTQTPSLIIHLGASMTDISIVCKGILEMVSYISLGGLAITRAVSIDLGIDISQAEDLKRAYGLTQNVFEGKVGQALNPILTSIVSDIKKAILLYREKSSESVTQIILSGGSALLPGLDVYFTNILGIQVVLGSCWKVNNIQNVPPEILAYAAAYNVVTGLALKDNI